MTEVCAPGLNCSPSYSITIRVEIENRIGMFARIATAISSAGGDLGSVDIVRVERGKIIRDITVNAQNEEHEKAIVKAIKTVAGVKVLRVADRTFFAHEGGKIEIRNKLPVRDRNDLSKVYTPGVARVCMDIHHHKEHAYRYTIKGNSVAVISDGTAVLGLGDIGPEAALPVMEGKAMIFKEFAGIDAFPIVLDTKDTDEIVNTVKNIAPAFGGINLEDFSAPHCFEVEARLRKLLDIPVFHDDQHGTSVVALAALINVSRLFKRDLKKFKVVVVGAGAAGTAVTKILLASGVRDIIVCDRSGALYAGRKQHMDPYKRQLAKITNPRTVKGQHLRCHEGGECIYRPVGAECDHGRRCEKHGQGPCCLRPREPGPGNIPRGSQRVRPGHGHWQVGLSEPDKQHARLPGHLPRSFGCPRPGRERSRKACRGKSHRPKHRDRRAARGLHHPQPL